MARWWTSGSFGTSKNVPVPLQELAKNFQWMDGNGIMLKADELDQSHVFNILQNMSVDFLCASVYRADRVASDVERFHFFEMLQQRAAYKRTFNPNVQVSFMPAGEWWDEDHYQQFAELIVYFVFLIGDHGPAREFVSDFCYHLIYSIPRFQECQSELCLVVREFMGIQA